MDAFFGKYYYWLSDASSYCILVPLLAGLYYWIRIKQTNGTFRRVMLFVFFITLVEASGLLSLRYETHSNLWISHIYVPFEYTILASIYYINFRGKPIKRAIVVSCIVFILFCMVESFLPSGMKRMNSYSRVLESCLLIGIVILYMYTLYKDLNYVYLAQDPMFVLSCGVLIFFAGTAMAYELFNYALAISDNTARICLCIVYILNIAFNLLLVVVQRKALAA